MQLAQELHEEEGVAAGLLGAQRCQLIDRGRAAAQGLGDQLAHRLGRQRAELQLADAAAMAGPPQCRLQRAQRVAFVDLVVAERADQQQGLLAVVAQQLLQQSQRRRIGPLQVVEEQQQRVGAPGQRLHEAAEGQVQTRLGVGCGQHRQRRWRADQQLQLRHQVADGGGMLTQCLDQQRPPVGVAALDGELLHQGAERIGQRGIRAMAAVLIALAAQVVAPSRHHRLVQRRHQRRLADARVAADQQQLAAAAAAAREGVAQGGDLRLAADQPLGDAKALADIVAAERELVDAPLQLQLLQRLLQVEQQAMAALVTRIRVLGQQLGDQRREQRRDRRIELLQRGWQQRQLRVQQRRRVVDLERRPTAEQLVQRCAQRVEIAALVDVEIGASGLLRRHIGQGAMREAVGAATGLVVERRREAEIAELQAQVGEVDEHVLGCHVAMHQAMRMHGADRLRELNRQLQALDQAEVVALDHLGEVAAAEILEHEHQAAARRLQAARADHIGRRDRLQQRVLVAPARELGGSRQIGVEQLQHHRLTVCIARRGNDGVADGVDDGIECEAGELHGGACKRGRPSA